MAVLWPPSSSLQTGVSTPQLTWPPCWWPQPAVKHWMARADQEVRASKVQLGTRAWDAEAQGRGKESNLCSLSALQSWERHCAPRPAQFPLLSLKDIPRLGCDKEMRCLSSRGLAEPAALWRASSPAECGATGHCSSTE